jgi:hypothetical protein
MDARESALLGWTPRFFRSIGSVARYNLAYVDTTFRRRIRQNSVALPVGHVSHGVG